jgi:site-specific DNA-methyltransferase (adenine-specific)
MAIEVVTGDCLDVLASMPVESANLIYIDPPFGTLRKHQMCTRDRTKEYKFDDLWKSLDE